MSDAKRHHEVVSASDTLLIRRQTLLPGEATHWHRDVCRRFSVVVRGDRLKLEFRDGSAPIEIRTYPGEAGWDDPEPRLHRAVNVGATVLEEVVAFHLDRPGIDPQPGE